MILTYRNIGLVIFLFSFSQSIISARMIEKLYEGEHSILYKAESGGTLYTVKDYLSGSEDRFKREAEAVRYINEKIGRSPYLARYDTIDDSKRRIVYQYIPHFLSNIHDQMSPKQKKLCLAQVHNMLNQLHHIGLCHGDIHTGNVGVNANNGVITCVLIDFEMAKNYDSKAPKDCSDDEYFNEMKDEIE